MEVVPLIMEPQSRLYTSPVIVFDFQSLYPSIVIAYNMCYSTVLGRLAGHGEGLLPKVGFAEYSPEAGVLSQMYAGVGAGTCIRATEPVPGFKVVESSRPARPNSTYISPNGTLFAPWHQRQGVLPRMLHEILETRIMIKGALKDPQIKSDFAKTRILHARQFALKMIANVTVRFGRCAISCCADMIFVFVSQ
jgi:DNA polymerase zeta